MMILLIFLKKNVKNSFFFVLFLVIVTNETLASIYTSTALSHEMFGDSETAFLYYKKAFEQWIKSSKYFFGLLCLWHLLSLETKINVKESEKKEFLELYQNLIEIEKLDQDFITTLFHNFNLRLQRSQEVS